MVIWAKSSLLGPRNAWHWLEVERAFGIYSDFGLVRSHPLACDSLNLAIRQMEQNGPHPPFLVDVARQLSKIGATIVAEHFVTEVVLGTAAENFFLGIWIVWLRAQSRN